MSLSWHRFAEEGACVVLWDINKAGVQAVQDEIKAKSQRAHAYTCDCSKREDIYRVAETVRLNISEGEHAGVVIGDECSLVCLCVGEEGGR